jgi:hypothetical protein
MIRLFPGCEHPLVGQIADAGRKPEPQQVRQGKYMIREACRISVKPRPAAMPERTKPGRKAEKKAGGKK